jgi:Domain of unknown function (DUF4349)
MSETLLDEIRATKPEAPSGLRERVRALAAQEPARIPFLARFEWRRLVLVAPATLLVAVIAGSVIGLTRNDVAKPGDEVTASGAGGAAATTTAFERAEPQQGALKGLAVPPAAADSAAPVPPVPGQLQRYEAELRLRVDDVEALSSATKRAQQIAIQHGGSVASLQYDAPAEGTGAAQITLRVPTARVQSAMAQLSQLGTIVGQRYGIDDLQVQADSLQTQIEQSQRRIAQILGQLESPTLSSENRAVLQSRLAASKQKLAGLREGLRATNAEARTATIYLTLTTEEIQPGTVGGSRIDDVKDVLAWEGIALLYVLIVAGPFVLLGIVVWLAMRLRRRQVETRLLEQN